MNKKSIVLASVTSLVLLTGALAGCGATSTSPSAPVTVTAPAAPSVPDVTTPSSSDAQFLATVHSVAPTVNNYGSDASTISLGKNVCTALDNGASFSAVGTTMIGAGLPAGVAGAIVGAAVANYCPSHLSDLQAFVNSPTA